MENNFIFQNNPRPQKSISEEDGIVLHFLKSL